MEVKRMNVKKQVIIKIGACLVIALLIIALN